MGTVYNVIWKDRLKNLFATMPTVMLVAIDIYAYSAIIIINSEHLMPIITSEIKWKVKHKVFQWM